MYGRARRPIFSQTFPSRVTYFQQFVFIKFSNRVHFAGNFVDYWVVKTDYTNYSVVYECSKLNDDNTCKKIITWVFSRHQTLPESLMAEVDHVIENLCLNETQFYTTTYSKSKTYFHFFEWVLHMYWRHILEVFCVNIINKIKSYLVLESWSTSQYGFFYRLFWFNQCRIRSWLTWDLFRCKSNMF